MFSWGPIQTRFLGVVDDRRLGPGEAHQGHFRERVGEHAAKPSMSGGGTGRLELDRTPRLRPELACLPWRLAPRPRPKSPGTGRQGNRAMAQPFPPSRQSAESGGGVTPVTALALGWIDRSVLAGARRCPLMCWTARRDAVGSSPARTRAQHGCGLGHAPGVTDRAAAGVSARARNCARIGEQQLGLDLLQAPRRGHAQPAARAHPSLPRELPRQVRPALHSRRTAAPRCVLRGPLGPECPPSDERRPRSRRRPMQPGCRLSPCTSPRPSVSPPPPAAALGPRRRSPRAGSLA